MFSFFKSSKKSPVASPTVEHRENSNISKNSDDFVLIGNNPSNIYPPINLPVNPSPSHPPFNHQLSVCSNYTNNVPFKLHNSLMSADNNEEIWNYKLKEMNSVLQRINILDYDFKLERSIVES